MNSKLPPLFALALLASISLARAEEPATPARQEPIEIKALAREDVEGYLAGKGMGQAKAAELNGYPGPSHVLALADTLALSPAQKEMTETLFKLMDAKAKQAGRELIAEERRLDQLFASQTVSGSTLAQSLERIGELQARVRQVHLESHLEQQSILTPAQIAAYNRLRGNGGVKNETQHKH